MFMLLYEDIYMRRMTVLDTKDGVVETMDTFKVLDIMTKNNISIKGIAKVGLQYMAYAQPYPAKEKKVLPRNCFVITKVFIDKGEYSRRITVQGFQIKDCYLDKKLQSVVIKDDTDLSKFYFSQHTYVGLDDSYMDECYSWVMTDGMCEVFKDKNGTPYNANMGTEVSEEMVGDFICKFLRKGYIGLSGV